MSLSLNFEPHSWYMGFAIKFAKDWHQNPNSNIWCAFTDDGNTYSIVEIAGQSLPELKANIRAYHLPIGNWYAEQINKGVSDDEIEELELQEFY